MNDQHFTLTEQHIKLLRAMSVGWNGDEFGAPCIDPKRPYGNEDAYGDMLRILYGKEVGGVCDVWIGTGAALRPASSRDGNRLANRPGNLRDGGRRVRCARVYAPVAEGPAMMTTPPTIAPPGAVCQVCRGTCAGELVEACAGVGGVMWYIHADYLVCALVALCRYRRAGRQ